MSEDVYRLPIIKRHGQPLDESSLEFKSLMRAFESRKISGHNRFTKKLKEYLQECDLLKGCSAYKKSVAI